MKKKFFVYNSFTGTPFHGNPAGVVPAADDLTAEEMQNIARQLNLVETVFILKSSIEGTDCRFRYFMPEGELPVAGHPTIAGWACLQDMGIANSQIKTDYIQETGAGNIRIRFQNEKIFASQKQANIQKLDNFLSPENLAVLGLEVADIDPAYPAAAIDAGLGHIIFCVKSMDSLMKMRFVPEDLLTLCQSFGMRECQIFCRETLQTGLTGHTRNLCPRYGLEDPACGNGNAALGAYFASFVSPASKILDLSFEQGHIVKMPACISVRVDNGDVMIGGEACKMIAGEIEF